MRKSSGISKSMFADTYYSMRARCEHKQHDSYSRYGGRGITVCDEWKRYPLLFVEWALTHGYKKGLTLDRIDNNKGYSPDNCRWATSKEQSMNRRVNVIVDGMSIQELAKKHNIKEKTLRDRFWGGYTLENAIREKPTRQKRYISKDGTTLKEIAVRNGIAPGTLRKRLSRGKSLDDAIRMKLQVHKIPEKDYNK